MQLRSDISVSVSAFVVDICSTSVTYMQQSLIFSVIPPTTSSPAPSFPPACLHSCSFSWFLSLEKLWTQQQAGEKKALALLRFFSLSAQNVLMNLVGNEVSLSQGILTPYDRSSCQLFQLEARFKHEFAWEGLFAARFRIISEWAEMGYIPKLILSSTNSHLGQDCCKTCKSKHITDSWFEIQIQAQTFPRLRKIMFDIWVRSRIKGSCTYWVWYLYSVWADVWNAIQLLLCQNITICMSTVKTEGKL